MNESVWPLERRTCQEKVEDVIRRVKDTIGHEISFSGTCKNCCVGVVDAVNSTKITAILKNEKMCEYYRIFLNSMATIAQEFDAKVIKNMGDNLLYYFPKTEDGKDRTSLMNTLECSLAMVESHPTINKLMFESGLPPVDYRVSCDYGKLAIAKSSNFAGEDLFGSTINMCSKINAIALPNHIVVGGDLFQISRSFNQYSFMGIAAYSLGFKLDYPIYSLYRAKNYISPAHISL